MLYPASQKEFAPGMSRSDAVQTTEARLWCEACEAVTSHGYIGSQLETLDYQLASHDKAGTTFRRPTRVVAHRFVCGCGTDRIWGIS